MANEKRTPDPGGTGSSNNGGVACIFRDAPQDPWVGWPLPDRLERIENWLRFLAVEVGQLRPLAGHDGFASHGRSGLPRPPVYLMSSLFLAEAFADLVRDPSEEMHYVTGSETDRYRILERLVTFAKAERTPVSVKGDDGASHRALIWLEANGHRLLAWMHSHPGNGPRATSPSQIDIGHQTRLEQGRYPAIGVIFSRDGYIRFYSREAPFTVRISGKGVTRIHDDLYHLDAH